MIEDAEYNFVQGEAKLVEMLCRAFPSSEDKERITKYMAELQAYRTQKTQTSATMFFRLKVS